MKMTGDGVCLHSNVDNYRGLYASKVYPEIKKKTLGNWLSEYCEYVLNKNGIYSGKVIDIGCGSGGECQYLFKNGYDVVGVDASADMIDLARKRNSKMTFYNAFAEDGLGTRIRHDAAISLDAFSEFENSRSVCRNVAKIVKTGGIFLFSYANGDAYWGDAVVHGDRIGDITRNIVQKFDGKEERVYVCYDYISVGKQSFLESHSLVVSLCLHLYSLWGVAAVLRPYFDIVHAYSGYTFDNAKWLSDKYITIVAERRDVDVLEAGGG